MITREFQAKLVRTGGVNVNIQLTVTLSYDPDTDPLAVQAIISAPGENDVVWHFSRELLERSVSNRQPTGRGDVKFRYLGPSEGGLLMCLKNPTGHADMRLPQALVLAFLDETRDAAIRGEAFIDAQVDEALEDILNS